MTNPYLTTDADRANAVCIQTLVSRDHWFKAFRRVYPARNSQAIILSNLFQAFYNQITALPDDSPLDTAAAIIARLATIQRDALPPSDRGNDRRKVRGPTSPDASSTTGGSHIPSSPQGESSPRVKQTRRKESKAGQTLR